jgi:hypothetical protein
MRFLCAYCLLGHHGGRAFDGVGQDDRCLSGAAAWSGTAYSSRHSRQWRQDHHDGVTVQLAQLRV